MINWEKIHEPLRSGLRRYVEEGVMPGGFLTAVLENDLFWAVARADGYNRTMLDEITKFVYWELPATCWGSKAQVDEWIKMKRKEQSDVRLVDA